jgi:hypothetical protein
MPYTKKAKRFAALCRFSPEKAKDKCMPEDVAKHMMDAPTKRKKKEMKDHKELFSRLVAERLHEAGSKRSISRMIRHLQGGGAVGVISAHRHEHSPEQNNKAMKALRGDLKARGLTAIPQHGTYPESGEGASTKFVHEKSFRIHHHDKDELTKHLKELGAKYKQDSVGIHTEADGMKFHATKAGGDDFETGKGMKIGPELANPSSPRYSLYRSSTANPKKPKKGKPFSYGS